MYRDMAIHTLCTVAELPTGTSRAFTIEGRGIALYNVDGVFYATQDFCRHKGGSLGKGTLNGRIAVCPLHGWRYDVTTGDCLTQPHCKKLALYGVRVEDGLVLLET